MFADHRLACIIDAQTSRQKINSDYLELMKNILTDLGVQKYAIDLVAGPRLDLLHAMQTRANSLFKNDRVVIIQMVSGQMQTRKSQPGWMLLIKNASFNTPVTELTVVICRSSSSFLHRGSRELVRSCQ